jgi:hypothetical protein
MTPNIGEDNSTTSSKVLDARELRIGNFVLSFLTKQVVTVDWIALKHLEDGNIQSIYTPEIPVYEPIPLNEEWLLRTPFEKVNDYRWETDMWMLEKSIITQKWHLRFRTSKTDSYPLCYVEHVHRLQNAFYTLTNSELTLKEKVI